MLISTRISEIMLKYSRNRAGNVLIHKYLYNHLNKSISFFLQLLFKPFLTLNNLLSFLFQQFFKLKLLIIFLCSTMLPYAYGLNCFTVKAIEGNSPEVVNLKVAADGHGFTVNGVFYSESTGNIKEGEIKEFDGNLELNKFVVNQFNYQAVDNKLNYQDLDGDGIDPIQPFLMTETVWQWFDANGNKITPSDKTKLTECGTDYALPLRLEISNQVQTFSQYGQPKQSDFVTLKKVYKISLSSKLCYVKPYAIEKYPSYQWVSFDSSNTFSGWNDPNYTSRTDAGGGYNSDYVPNLGFKINPTESGGKKFPTTGFKGAKFQLIFNGPASDYTFTIPNNPGKQVIVDENGYVTLNGKPKGDVTVRATLKRDSNVKHDYTFNPTSIWVNPVRGFRDNWMEAIKKCGEDNLLSYKELTNAPLYEVRGDWKQQTIYNAYTRAIGEGVFPEWGYTIKESYPDSNWEHNKDRYWTKDRYYGSNYGNHVDVNSGSGLIGVDDERLNAPDFLVCK